jgi:Domain of unknown function (DUF5615)
MLKYLLDEHVPPAYRQQLLRRESSLMVRIIGDPGVPPKGTLDPELLLWCEREDFVIVTNNRNTMPSHLADHLAEGRHMPGIFILNPSISFGDTIEELILLTTASVEGEFRDKITFLPYKG